MMLQRFLLCFLLILSGCSSHYEDPRFVMDDPSRGHFEQRFRLEDPHNAALSRKIQHLHVVASDQLSIPQLNALIQAYPEIAVIVDLRKEPHFFINGHAITWADAQDWVDKDMTPDEVRALEKRLMEEVRAQKELLVFQKIHEDAQKKEIPRKLYPQFLSTEKDWAASHNIGYLRLFIPDHVSPTIAQINHFIRVYQALQPQKSLYIHCRGGMGRTTTFLALVDMMHNAKKDSFETILKRQHHLHGEDLMKPKTGYKAAPAEKRLALLKAFYQYAKTNDDNFQTLFKD